jgi:histone H3/H4
MPKSAAFNSTKPRKVDITKKRHSPPPPKCGDDTTSSDIEQEPKHVVLMLKKLDEKPMKKSKDLKRRQLLARVEADKRNYGKKPFIPRAPFQRIVHDAVVQFGPKNWTPRIQRSAIEMLHHRTEAFVRNIFYKVWKIAQASHNETALVKHLQVLIELCEDNADVPFKMEETESTRSTDAASSPSQPPQPQPKSQKTEEDA